MSINAISSQSLYGAGFSSVQLGQKNLVDLQTEVSTGRLANVGESLGANIDQAFNARAQLIELDGFQQSTNLVSGRLQATQTALGSMATDVNTMISNLQTASNNSTAQTTAVTVGSGLLSSFQDYLNTSYDGVYIFGGINSSQPPVGTQLTSPASTGLVAVQTAFQSYFGFSTSDPKVANITSQQLTTFLNGPFQSVFSGASWSNFSSASSANLQDRISAGQVVTSSANANDPSFQSLAKGYLMVSALGGTGLSQGAFQTLASAASSALSAGGSGITQIQANLGAVQQQCTAAQQVNTTASNLLQAQVNKLEGTDPYQIVTQLNSLTNQLEASYSTTNRIQKLSILNYLT